MAKKKCHSDDAIQPAPEDEPVERDDEAERSYIESLVESGQAAQPDSEGKLPPGATHEIVEDDEGHLRVIRRRFSAH